MSEPLQGETVRTTVIVSPPNSLSRADLKRWARNFLEFSAPTLVVLFTELALGLSWKAALPIALLTFYGTLRDLFKKYKKVDIQLAEGSDVNKLINKEEDKQ